MNTAMNKIIGCVASFALAFSLFAMPAMAAADTASSDVETATVNENDTSNQNASNSSDSSNSSDENTDGAKDDSQSVVDGEISIEESPSSESDSGSENENPSSDADNNEQAPSLLDSIAQFFANLSPFSISGENLQDASIVVTLTTLVPNAAQAAGNDLTLSLYGTSGGGTHTVKFSPKPTTYENFITDVHGSSGSAQVRAAASTEFVAEIDHIPAGTYRVEVTGSYYGKYRHGSELTLRDGDRASFSLVDSLYGNPIPSDNNRVGLVPYGDFNRDDKVDDLDSAAISQAVHQKSTDLIYDLTGDGKVDLADVQHFAHTVNKSHAATDVSVTKDVSQMDSKFSEGTIASIKYGGTGTPVQDAAQAGTSLFYDDGDTVELKHETGADISADTPVGFNIDSKGVDIAAFEVDFPLDEHNKPYNMGDGGKITLHLDDPVPGETENDKIYTLYANIVEATGNIADLVPPSSVRPDEHPYDFMYERVKAYLYKETGQLVVVFGSSVVPVKLRSAEIEFTSTTNPSKKTVEVSNIEFLNSIDDMDVPVFPDTPEITSIETANKSISLSWAEVPDAVKYDVEVGLGNQTDVHTTSAPTFTITKFDSADLQNGTEYKVRIRSVGLYEESKWSDPVSAIPENKTAPSNVTGLTLSPGYSQITASWDAVENADSYTLYFKKADASSFSSAELEATSYTVKSLDTYSEYEFYVVAENGYGTSQPSETVKVSTTSAGGKIPWFKLINRASQNADKYPAANSFASVEVGDLDAESAKAVVDGNFDSYVELGNASVSTGGTNKAISATFKDAQSVRNLAITTYLGEGYSDNVESVSVNVYGKDGGGADYTSELTLDNGLKQGSVPTEGGSESTAVNTIYVELPHAFDGVNKMDVSFTRADGGLATVSELAFYAPSGLEESVAGIWADGYPHLKLRDGISDSGLDAIETQLNQTDNDSQEGDHASEKHPLLNEFQTELTAAREMLHAADPTTLSVNNAVTTAGACIGGLNAWQPLGITAKAGEKIKVYVSTPSKKSGEATKLRLIASQYMGDQNSQFAPVGYLLSGMNEITVPEVGELAEGQNVERGGALYLEYTGDSAEDAYDVNILGGSRMPVLDLTGLSGEDVKSTRDERISQYVSQLEEYVNSLSTVHNDAKHTGTGLLGMFENTGCLANITEIITDHAILTLPATEVVLELGSADISGAANKIDTLAKTTDNMLNIAYQHKGVFTVADNPRLTRTYGANNNTPNARHNIRCMTMDDGNTVCSTNNYIGITWDSIGDLLKVEPLELNEDGSYKSGSLLGALIAHALGHQLSDNASAIPEVTANYFTQLLTSHDSNESVVFNWDDVIARVSSGTKGSLDSRLGAACLWQLHLAYDDGYSYTTYNDPDDQMSKLIFARMNAYARNVEEAPYGLTLEGADSENKLMRLACAAADRNVLAFFEAWGLEPDAASVAYASNFASETREIQYITDDSRKTSGVKATDRAADAKKSASETKGATISADIHFDSEAQNVLIENISLQGADGVNVYGYEILRKVAKDDTLDGQTEGRSTGDEYKVVGFVTGGETSFSEAAVLLPEGDAEYKIRAIDDSCNALNTVDTLTVRVGHNSAKGGVSNFTMPTDKSKWTVTSNMESIEEAPAGDDLFDSMDCTSGSKQNLSRIVDSDKQTSFVGDVAKDSVKQQVTIAFNETLDVSGIRYYPSSKEKSFKGLDIELSDNGKDWTHVNTSMLYFSASDNYKGFDAFGRSDNAVIYFSEADVTGDSSKEDKLATYSASYIRLTEWCDNTDPVAIAELDVISAPIYRVSLMDAADHFGMGKLTEDVLLESSTDTDGADEGLEGKKTSVFIPKGSFIIMGNYTGNPAYNTIIVKDQKGNIIVDPSQQTIITNKVNETDAAIIDSAAMVREGTWLYYFEPGTYEDKLEEWGEIHPELYRTDESASMTNAKFVSMGSGAKIQRQGINDDMSVDLYGITLKFESYDVHR